MPVNPIQQKNELDQFYTSDKVVDECLSILRPFVQKYKIDFYVEPSAGTGAFFKRFSKNIFGFDLEPKCDGVAKKNWYDVERSDLPEGDFCIIGNPPFGIRNVDSKGFIRKAISLKGCKMIAFVIPQVFEKLSIQKVFPSNWKLLSTSSTLDDGFILEGEPYHVPCVFQVWTCFDSDVDLREQEPVLDNNFFEFVKQEDSDVFVFGAAPKNIISPQEVKPNNRGYFLKLKVDKNEFIDRSNSIDWKSIGKSSVNGGAFWLTKGEYVRGFVS